MIRYPNIIGKTDAQKLDQMRSYLHQLADELNYQLDKTGNIGSGYPSSAVDESALAKPVKKDDAISNFNDIKALIIKSADIVDAYYEEINKKLEGQYVAESDFGTYKEETQAQLTASSNQIKSVVEKQETIEIDMDTLERDMRSEIKQTADSIKLEVTGGEPGSTASIKLSVGEGDDKKEYTGTIDMKGLVTFSNLANADGTTVINGSNITTGQILADLIKAGTIKSKDGESVVLDLDNGTLNAVGTLRTLLGQNTYGYQNMSEMTHEGFTIGTISESGTIVKDAYLRENALRVTNNRNGSATINVSHNDSETAKFSIEKWSKMGTSSIRLETLSDYDSLQNMAVIQMQSAAGQGSLAIMVSPGESAIHGLTPPTGDSDAVNKAYVDSGLSGKLDTSATATNADKLDGYHIDATWGRSVHTIDVSAYPYSPDYYYPVLVYIPNWIKTRLALIVALNTNVPSWATHSSGFSCNIDVSLTRSGWGAQGCSYTKWHDDWRLCGDKKPAWFGGFVYTTNLAVFYVRGGGVYNLYSDDRDISQPTIVNPSYTDPSGSIYVPVTSIVDYWIGNSFDLDTIETNIKGNVEGNAIYAPNSSQLFSSDSQYAYDGVAPYYGHLTYESPYWRFKVYPETPANVIVARSDTSAYADSAGSVYSVTGVYTGSGGAQPPSYVGSGTVRFNMMERPSGLGGHEYCDYMLMDTYVGGDVPYVTAIGVAKTSVPKAYIAVGQKGNTSGWLEEAEIVTTRNACSFDSGAVSTTSIQDSGSASNFYVVHVYVSGYGYTSIVIDKAQINTSTYRYYYVHGGGYVGAYKSSNTVTFITDGSSPATTINHIRGYI